MFIGVRSLTTNKGLDAQTEQMLLEQCRRQNFDAFSQIVDAYQHRVFGFVKRMVGTVEEAEDIAQEVFVRAFQNIGRFDGRCNLRTWLFRIAHNLCIDQSRKKGRHMAAGSLVDAENEQEIDVLDERWNPEAIIMTEELHRVVEKSIESMSEKLRTVLLLHDQEELPYEELAQLLDLPIGTVKSRLFLARQHIANTVRNYLEGTV